MEPTEGMGEIYESLKLLLACVDALERRVAELEYDTRPFGHL